MALHGEHTSSAPTWAVLEEALVAKRRVRLRYAGHERTICPHVLGWKNDRAKVLAYQVEGTTSQGRLAQDPTQRWRSMFVSDIDQAMIVEGSWQSSPNYGPTHNGIDEVALQH